MLDLAAAYNRYKFLGHEFLTWLWFVIENESDQIPSLEENRISIEIGNRIAFENRRSGAKEHITIKGDDAGLEEGLLALRKGAVVTEMNLQIQMEEFQWQFTIKGENLTIAGLKTPETGKVESQEDIEGSVLEKGWLCEQVVHVVDMLFLKFCKIRITPEWEQKKVPQIIKWISTD